MPTNPVVDNVTAWTNRDRHVDSTISTTLFTNAAHTIIYARPYNKPDAKFRPIGVIQGWNHTEQKQVEEIFELGSDVRYIVPGRTTGQIAITRMLINGPDLINVLYNVYDEEGNLSSGAKPIRSLKDINRAVDIMFATYTNDEDSTNSAFKYFDNAWVVARQESITANQVVIAENCTMVYEKVTDYNLSAPSPGA